MKVLSICFFLAILLTSIFFDQFLLMGYANREKFDRWKKSIVENNNSILGRAWKFLDETIRFRWIAFYVGLVGTLVSSMIGV